ncbi:MAG: tetratricopeptide repeat protein, partial [Acidimicrobiia bacterium]
AYCKSFLGAELSRRDADLDRALELLRESQQIYADLDQRYGGAWVDRYLGLCHQERGGFDESIRLQTLSLNAFRDTGDEWNIRFGQTLLAEAMHTVADLAWSREMYDDSLRGSSSSRFKVVVAHALKGLGKVSLAEGKLDEAFEDLGEAMHQLREIGDVACVAETRGHVAMVHLGKERTAEAEQLLAESLATFYEISDHGGMAWTLERLAAAAAAKDSFDRAARLLGVSDSIRTESGSQQAPVYEPDVDHLTTTVRYAMGDEAYEALAGLGAALDLEDAFALGMDV